MRGSRRGSDNFRHPNREDFRDHPSSPNVHSQISADCEYAFNLVSNVRRQLSKPTAFDWQAGLGCGKVQSRSQKNGKRRAFPLRQQSRQRLRHPSTGHTINSLDKEALKHYIVGLWCIRIQDVDLIVGL